MSAGTAPAPRLSLGLVAICLGFLMITLDATIVNVALGPILTGLGGSLASAQWIVNGYTLAFAALLLSAGAVSDRIGARRGYLVGLVTFGIGSALCSAAGSLGLLVAARVIQGAGAAYLMPCSLALIAHMFPDPHDRRRALAVWGGVSGIGLAAGPILGGVLTGLAGWRAIFLVNLPVAVVALTMLLRHVEETRRHSHRLDPAGQVLGIATLSLLTGGFIIAGQHGWTAPISLGLFAAGVLSAVAFVVCQRRVDHPMVDPVLFQRRAFTVSVMIGLTFNFCLYGGLFCLAIDLTDARRLSAPATGIAMLPMTIAVGLFAFASGRVTARLGAWAAMVVGLGVGAVGATLVAVLPAQTPIVVLTLSTIPLGVMAVAMPAMTATAMSGAPGHRIGLASGVLNTSRQTGGAMGVAVLGALLHLGGATGVHVAFGVIAIVFLLGATLALGGRRADRPPATVT